MDNKELYNEIYTKNKAYNHNVMYKYVEVSKFAHSIKQSISNPKILDAGCGEGWNVSKLIEEGFDTFGIEISDVCCTTFLQNLPHKCTDIVSYSKEGITYDALLCFDVLEHISHEDIENVIAALSIMAPKCLLGVAHHSDIQFGHELHLIQEGIPWWEEKFKKHFSSVQFVNNLGGNFYLFECKNESI
jgi:2-polyprenyl-3-methyl-5-hydroxy-6-metoxy-1,4-benzoquinol methylase